MKNLCILLFLCFCLALPCFAVSGNQDKAVVHSMRKVPCPGDPQPMRMPGMTGMVPQDSGGNCMEYELRTEKVVYTVRPHNPVLLALGSNVVIAVSRADLMVRSTEHSKEIRCNVMAMALRTDVERAEREKSRAHAAPTRCYQGGLEVPCPRE